MRRTSLLIGALLLSARTVTAQTGTLPQSSPFRVPAQTSLLPGVPNNPTTLVPDQAAPAPSVEVPEQLTTFDGSQVRLLWQDRTWKLIANGVVVKDFGRREPDARQAERLIQSLRLTQHGTVGAPNPVIEYWLSDGQAPLGLTSGLRTMALDTASLKVEQSQGQWVVRDRQRVWFNFGTSAADARQAVTVIQKHGFTQVALIGAPAPTMMLFLGNPVRPGSGAATFRPPQTAITDPSAALAGYASAALPALSHAAAQPNQPIFAYHQEPITSLSASRPTTFLRGASVAAPAVSEQVAFDWRQAQVRQEKGHWLVAAGSHVLADFGGNQYAATEALKAVQYYRFTEHCQVGQSAASCSYFLVGGQAPRGIPFGVQGQQIDVAHLGVQQVGENYAVVSGGRPVLQCGQRPEEARQMVEVIRRHKFDHVCHFGGPEEQGMTFLVQAR